MPSKIRDADILVLGSASLAINLVRLLAQQVGIRWFQPAPDENDKIPPERLTLPISKTRNGWLWPPGTPIDQRLLFVGCEPTEDLWPVGHIRPTVAVLFDLAREFDPATRRWAALVAAFESGDESCEKRAATLGATPLELYRLMEATPAAEFHRAMLAASAREQEETSSYGGMDF